jgi:hypothetical protein
MSHLDDVFSCHTLRHMKYALLVGLLLVGCGGAAEPGDADAGDAGRDALTATDAGSDACGPIADPSGQCDWINTCNGLCGHADAGRD